MIDNKLDNRAIKVLSDASLIYPDSFDLWQTWSSVPTATPDQIAGFKSSLAKTAAVIPGSQVIQEKAS